MPQSQRRSRTPRTEAYGTPHPLDRDETITFVDFYEESRPSALDRQITTLDLIDRLLYLYMHRHGRNHWFARFSAHVQALMEEFEQDQPVTDDAPTTESEATSTASHAGTATA